MLTRDNVRDTASTLAHHWCGADTVKDREGVRRVLALFTPGMRTVLCALILHRLECLGAYTQAAAFEAMLHDIAGVPADEDRARYVLPTAPEVH